MAARSARNPSTAGMPATAPGSFELSDARSRLRDLARAALGDIVVSHVEPARMAADQPALNLYFLSLEPPPAQSRQAGALQLHARFLATAWGPDAEACGDALAELAFAALQAGDLETGTEPFPAQAWAALGVAPRPAFTLTLPLRRMRLAAGAPPVREAVLHLAAGLVPVRGSVTAADAAGVDQPLAGARIESAELACSATTDHLGRFELRPAPRGRALRLLVSARGARALFPVRVPDDGEACFALQMNLSQSQTSQT